MMAGTVTAVVHGWDLWPQWACASILVATIAEFVIGQIIDIPMGTTDLFLRSAEALVVACETLEVQYSSVHVQNVNTKKSYSLCSPFH